MKRLMVAVVLTLGATSTAFGDVAEVYQAGSSVITMEAACSTWSEPSGDEYEWITMCARWEDEDENGSIDVREVWASQSFCDGDATDPGARFCSTGEHYLRGDLTANEFAVDFDGGTASLHAVVDHCAIDTTWAATASAEEIGSASSRGVGTQLNGPIQVSLDVESEHLSTRDAAFAGSLCVAVIGAPDVSDLYQLRRQNDSTGIRVDPAA